MQVEQLIPDAWIIFPFTRSTVTPGEFKGGCCTASIKVPVAPVHQQVRLL